MIIKLCIVLTGSPHRCWCRRPPFPPGGMGTRVACLRSKAWESSRTHIHTHTHTLASCRFSHLPVSSLVQLWSIPSGLHVCFFCVCLGHTAPSKPLPLVPCSLSSWEVVKCRASSYRSTDGPRSEVEPSLGSRESHWWAFLRKWCHPSYFTKFSPFLISALMSLCTLGCLDSCFQPHNGNHDLCWWECLPYPL